MHLLIKIFHVSTKQLSNFGRMFTKVAQNGVWQFACKSEPLETNSLVHRGILDCDIMQSCRWYQHFRGMLPLCLGQMSKVICGQVIREG